MADEEMYAMMNLPMQFGKAPKKKVVDEHRFDKSKRDTQSTPAVAPSEEVEPFLPDAGSSKPSGPKTKSQPSGEDNTAPAEEDEDDDDDVDDMEDDAPQFPTTHEIVLKAHTKVISAIALDPPGARIVSGSHDYDTKCWDFGGMGATIRPFKSFEAAGSYYVHDLKFSNAGDLFLVVSGTTQAKLYSRDGEEKGMFIKGDPYIRDMKRTDGHVGEITSCAWHPYETNTFITSSADSTVRIWDVENRRKQKTVIVVKSKDRGTRTKVTSCAYSADSKTIASACLDGALHMWSTSSNFVRPSLSLEGAHVKGTHTGSVSFSLDGKTVLTRGGDDTVKVWDLRSFKAPLHTAEGLTVLYPSTNAVFSPDEKYVVTGGGTATQPGAKTRGQVTILKRDGLQIQETIPMESCVSRVYWHSRINQILTGHADGSIHLLYSPQTSVNGAKLLTIPREKRKVTVEDTVASLLEAPIITPGETPMFTDDPDLLSTLLGKRKREHGRNDPRKATRPELPISGPGKGGRVGASATQHVVQNLFRDSTREEDPREALLKYADVADSNPRWTGAWKQNQPKPVFQDVDQKEQTDDAQ